MRSRRPSQEDVAAVSRRRLELLSAELAAVRASAAEGWAESAREPAAEPPGPAHSDTARADTARAETEAGLLPRSAEPLGPGTLPPGRHARRSVGRGGRWRGWLTDRLPPTLQGRVGLRPGHVTVLALMVATAMAVTSWWVLRADGSTTLVPAPTSTTADDHDHGPDAAGPALVTPAAQAATVTTEGSEPAVVVVDVAGKVRRPGIATLPVGSRVVDALEAAGGVRRGVDLTTLNLARLLVDGEQIVVGVPPPPGIAAPAASGAGAAPTVGALVNLNTATQPQLEELPGVGPVTASAILQWRVDNGAFTSVDELMEVSGIGEATLAEIAPHVTL